jgi:hypothetical protein
VQRGARLGTLADLDAGIELLADFGTEWWRRSVQGRLAASTRRRYAEVWDGHVLPRLGDYELRQLRAGVIDDELVSAMLADGVGLATVRKALYMLRSCLGYPRCGAISSPTTRRARSICRRGAGGRSSRSARDHRADAGASVEA